MKITVKSHRTLAIVGESGSGKSLLAKAILGLLAENIVRAGGFIGAESRLHFNRFVQNILAYYATEDVFDRLSPST